MLVLHLTGFRHDSGMSPFNSLSRPVTYFFHGTEAAGWKVGKFSWAWSRQMEKFGIGGESRNRANFFEGYEADRVLGSVENAEED